jgi:hypothetical protein
VSQRGFLVSLCLVAVTIRLCVGALLLNAGPAAFVLASDDGDAYDAAARSKAFGAPVAMTERMAGKWAPGTPVEVRWPPGYWLFLAAQYRLFGSAYVSTVVLQALVGAAEVLAVYGLARTVLSEKPARVAAVAQAVSSTAVYLSAALYAEALYVPMLIGGLALVAQRKRGPPAFVAGALFALAEVTRPLALAVFVVAVIWAARSGLWRALCLGFLLALSPFVANDLLNTGQITVFTAGGSEAMRDQLAQGVSLPERVLTMFVSGGWVPLGEPIISDLGPGGLLVGLGEWLVAAIGCIWLLLPRQRGRQAWLLVAAAAAIVGPPLLIGLPLVRYRAPADPLFIVWMVAGVQALFQLARERAEARRLSSPSQAPAE